MKRYQFAILMLSTLVYGTVTSQVDLSGTWEGDLVITEGTAIEVQFTFQKSGDNSYIATLNALDQPSLTNVKASFLSYEGSNLTINVDEVSGIYQGRLEDGVFQGTWTQQESSFPLALRPYVEPLLSQSDMHQLLGSWIGELRPVPGGEMKLTVVFRFEINDEGDFLAFLDSPDQGSRGTVIDRVALSGDELVLSAEQYQLGYTGKISGGEIVGTFTQGPTVLELNLEKGAVPIVALDLSADYMEKLEGSWHGKLGPLNIVTRFEKTNDGQMQGFIDSPDQGVSNITINEAEAVNDRLTLKISAFDGIFDAAIEENELVGEWTQAGLTQPLTLQRGPYVP